MSDDFEFRLVEEETGMPVAFASASSSAAALREIRHYHAVYSQDGPYSIECKMSGGWRLVIGFAPTSTPPAEPS